MAFLNPIMLFGLTAVSVPIIIHLLNRRRFQKVVWAAMRFLKLSVEQNQRRMQIEDLILLALRCLLLALLALALARPALMSNSKDVFGQSKVTGVILLDNSYSMGVSDGTRTRFDKAREAALQAIDSMPVGSATQHALAKQASELKFSHAGQPRCPILPVQNCAILCERKGSIGKLVVPARQV